MKKASLLLLTSNYEGFPNVVLEANACGKFVISFRCPGVDEEVITENKNGCLIENNDLQAFATAIEKHAKEHHKEEMIKESVEKYAIEQIGEVYKNLFNKNLKFNKENYGFSE